jgi:hypothetical protein
MQAAVVGLPRSIRTPRRDRDLRHNKVRQARLPDAARPCTRPPTNPRRTELVDRRDHWKELQGVCPLYARRLRVLGWSRRSLIPGDFARCVATRAFRSYLRWRKVSLRHFLEILHGLVLPVAVPFKLPRHQLCHSRSGFNASPSAEQQARVLRASTSSTVRAISCANGSDHLGADVGQVRMKLFCQRRLVPRNFPNRGRIGAINPKAWFRDGLPSPSMDLQMLGLQGRSSRPAMVSACSTRCPVSGCRCCPRRRRRVHRFAERQYYVVNCLHYKWHRSCNLRFVIYPILVLVGEPDAKEPSA